ncbi:MAG: outer membrane beta-barrel protein [Gemmatimonadales bacterium]
MRPASLAVSLSLAATVLASADASAQESTTRGFNLGLHLSGQSLDVENDDENRSAGGAGLLIGYGFNRTIQLFLQLDAGQFDVENADVEGEWTMGHADLGVRFHFANSLRSWVPYLQAALSGRAVGVKDGVINQTTQADEITLTGGALSLGGGILFYFNETFALDLQLIGSAGTFTELSADNVTVSDLDIDASSGRLNIGVSWWP